MSLFYGYGVTYECSFHLQRQRREGGTPDVGISIKIQRLDIDNIQIVCDGLSGIVRPHLPMSL